MTTSGQGYRKLTAMQRSWLIGSLLAVSLSMSVGARAQNAERIKSAAAEYDAGRRAYTDNKFEEAAIHFENAYHDAPNAQTLRNAMRARRQSGQLSRAATLAALAQVKYSDDKATMDTARDTLVEADQKLHRVSVTCDPECGVAADSHVVSLEDATKLTLYFEPGAHTLTVSWPGDRSKELKIESKPGTKQDFTLTAPPMPVKPPPPDGNTNTPVQTVVTGPPPPPPSTKPLGPALFFVGLSLTAISGGVLAWSGVDTLNNPGTDVVKQKCVGLGETCPEYQTGRNAQLRTNILIGVTAGLGVLTGVIGLFLTQWSTPKREAARLVSPTLVVTPTGGAVGFQGAF